jgi:hypothetical protein
MTYNLNHALDALEVVCDNQAALINYHMPDLQRVVETITLLPRGEQQEYMGWLERISLILESQMIGLGEELEALRKQIPAVQSNNAASHAYRKVVAVFPVHPGTTEDSH